MKVKRYMVKNMQEALYLIKKDLGPDAIIVSSHKVRDKGLKGLFSPAKIEVVAAINQNTNPELGPRIYEQANSYSFNRPSDHLTYHKISQCLLKLDIEPEIIEYLLKNLDFSRPANEINEALQQRLISVFKPTPVRTNSPNIMAFVGVPGVGKTTTLAKIAAISFLFKSFSIGIITIDTFRVGAVEQIRMYGDILGTSVEMVTSPVELLQAVQKYYDKDLILIDTAGRPSKNLYQLSEINSYLETINNLDIYLVINATTKGQDIMRIIKDFKVIPYNHLIISKIDETEYPGTLLNAAYWTGLPIAYITNGQDVPEDIVAASPELLATYIMKDVVY